MKYSLFNVDEIFSVCSLNFEALYVDIYDKIDQNVFTIIINNNDYDNLNINDESRYCKISESADQTILNTKLTIKLHERRNFCE